MREINTNSLLSYYNTYDTIVMDYNSIISTNLNYNPTVGSSLEEYLLNMLKYEDFNVEKKDINFLKKDNIEPMKF